MAYFAVSIDSCEVIQEGLIQAAMGTIFRVPVVVELKNRQNLDPAVRWWRRISRTEWLQVGRRGQSRAQAHSGLVMDASSAHMRAPVLAFAASED